MELYYLLSLVSFRCTPAIIVPSVVTPMEQQDHCKTAEHHKSNETIIINLNADACLVDTVGTNQARVF